jgi:hypothetical protein
MVQTALEAAALLDKRGVHIEVVNARFCKPLDEKGILAVCDRHDRVVTLEDHSRVGGFGSTVLECLACHGPGPRAGAGHGCARRDLRTHEQEPDPRALRTDGCARRGALRRREDAPAVR